MPSIDVEQFRQWVREEARRDFSWIQTEHPDETFYAFALYADDDPVPPTPSSNSEEGLQRCLKQYQVDPQSEESYIYRWGTAEWAYEAQGSRDRLPMSGWCEMDEDPDDYHVRKAKILGAMTYGLKDLSDEGFFGTGDHRKRVTVFCSLSDSADAVWLEQESARRINPSDVFAEFERQTRIATFKTTNGDHYLNVSPEFQDAFYEIWGTGPEQCPENAAALRVRKHLVVPPQGNPGEGFMMWIEIKDDGPEPVLWNPETREELIRAERFLKAAEKFDPEDPTTHIVEF